MIDLCLPPYEPPAIIREAPDIVSEGGLKERLAAFGLIPLGMLNPNPIQLFIGDTYEDLTQNSDTISTSTISLNTTCQAGDLVILCANAADNDFADDSVGMSITGWTSVTGIGGFTPVGNNWTYWSFLWRRTASGGETGYAISGSLDAFSGTCDSIAFKLFVVRGLNSNTPIDAQSSKDTSTATSLADNINTQAAWIVFIAAAHHTSATMSGGGNITEYNHGTQPDTLSAYDDAPLGGASDTYTVSGTGGGSAIALGSWG